MIGILEQIGPLLFAQAAPALPAASEISPAVQVQSVWDFVVKGGPMMIPIGLCSLIAMTVLVERLFSLRRRTVIPGTLVPGLREVLDDERRGRDDAVERCCADGSPLASVLAAGLRRVGGPLEVMERHVQEAGRREVLKLGKFLRVLSVIAAVSPLMGLLGTIFGMIAAFQTVATSADALGKTEMLAGGIYEAMITTAAGLLVAIPTLICYHWLSARVQGLVMEIDEKTVEFLESLAADDGGRDLDT